MQLSQRLVESAKPRSAPYTVSDGTGLHLLVHPTGTKSYIWRWRVGNTFPKITIGRAKAMKLDDARTIAMSYTAAVKAGRDPLLELKAEKAKVRVTVAEAWKLFDAKRLSERKQRTRDEYDRIFHKDAEPIFGSSAITAITRDDIERLLEEVLERSKGGALGLYSVLSSFFGWCASKRILTGLEVNPMSSVCKPCEGFAPRTRNLHMDECRWLLLACAELRKVKGATGRWASAVETMFRVPFRDSNATKMDRTAIRKGILSIKSPNAKNSLPNDIPLPQQVLDIIDKIERPEPESTLVFQRLHHKERYLNVIRKKMARIAGEPVEHWSVHDLRRTFDTIITDEYDDADGFVIEALMCHKVQGVKRHYNQSRLLKKKARHLNWWNEWLDGLLLEQQRLAA